MLVMEMSNKKQQIPAIRFNGFTDAWEQRKFSNVVNRVSQQSNDSNLPKVEFEDIVSGEGRLNKDISHKFDSRKGTVFEPEFILYGKLRPYLKNWLFPNFKGIALGDFWVFEPNNSSSIFDYYLIQSDKYQTVANISSGTKMPRSDWKTVSETVFSIPDSINEQEKIGAFFKHLDNTIALHQQKQRQIRSLKQGFIKNLFPNNKNSAPRIRFSIFNDDWNQRNASEIFTSVSDKNYPELPVLSASQEKGMVLRESNGIDIKYDQKSTGTYKRVLPGQFVMHLRSFQGGFAYSTIEGITSPAYTILAFRNKEDHYPLFWKSIFSSKNFIKRLEAITYGIRDGRSISYADFSTLRFWIPSYEEQKQIGDFIESIDATIAFYQRQIDMMQSLKKELLNKMFI